jgi:hypothetical protein
VCLEFELESRDVVKRAEEEKWVRPLSILTHLEALEEQLLYTTSTPSQLAMWD